MKSRMNALIALALMSGFSQPAPARRKHAIANPVDHQRKLTKAEKKRERRAARNLRLAAEQQDAGA